MSATEGEVIQELEEGELEDSDVEDGTYIPLARPEAFNPPSLVNMQIQDEQSDEAEVSSPESVDSESDGEMHKRPKRPKIKPRRPRVQSLSKADKYSVWCKPLQEELLTEDMISCDMRKKNRRYGVEAYDYTIKYRLEDSSANNIFNNTNNDNEYSNKRKYADRGNVKLRLGKRENKHEENSKRDKPRILADLSVTEEDPIENIASEIAEKLHEDKGDLVAKIVAAIGVTKAIELYKKTQKIEAEGGMLIMNGKRRRTSGGIYFFLLKRDDDISRSVVEGIFSLDKKNRAREMKSARAKSRQKVVEELKQSLTDADLPSLVSRGEATVQTDHGSNPPPSPATDARDCSSDTDAPAPSPARPPSPLPDRPLNDYDDDDCLEVTYNDDMDMF